MKTSAAHNAAQRKYAAANPARMRAIAKKYYAAHRSERLAYARKRSGAAEATRPCPARCECCGGPPVGRSLRLHLDHDHVTGAFRGWLCGNCNRAIGLLSDTLAGVQQAISYLTGDFT